MEKIAVFPGSFDPITVGHESIIRRALPLFDKIIIAIGYNADKQGFFSVETRKKFLEKVFENETKIQIETYTGLTVDFCKNHKVKYLLRGLRTSADFEFERSIGQTNKVLSGDIETIFMLTEPEHTFINSSVVRDILRHKGNVEHFVPKSIYPLITKEYHA